MTTPDLTSAGTASRAGGREGLLRGARIGAAAAVTVMVLLLDLISYSQLIFAGPLAESRAAGLSGLLAAYVLGSLQRQWLTSLCTVMFFFYPTVVTALLSIYDCQGVDSPAVSASNPLVVSH